MNAKTEIPTELSEPDFIDAEFTAANAGVAESGVVEIGAIEVDGDVTQAQNFPLIALAPKPAAVLSIIELKASDNPRASDSHPALVYLARLAPGSRRTMSEALTVIAGKISAGRYYLWSLA